MQDFQDRKVHEIVNNAQNTTDDEHVPTNQNRFHNTSFDASSFKNPHTIEAENS